MNQKVYDDMLKDVSNALKLFGEYTFLDKGPDEVLRVSKHVYAIKALPVEEAASTLMEFAKVSVFAEALVSNIICRLDNWEELFDETAPWASFIEKYY